MMPDLGIPLPPGMKTARIDGIMAQVDVHFTLQVR